MWRKRAVLFLAILAAGAALWGLVLAANPAPVPPATFTATVRSACAVDLVWTGGGPLYAVQYTTNFTFFQGGTELTTIQNLNAAHEGLTPATSYLYHIQSIDGVLRSAWSSPLSATTAALPTAPAVPTVFTAAGANDPQNPANDGKQVDLAWTSGTLSRYGGFEIEHSDDGGNTWVDVATQPYNARLFRDGGGLAPLLDNSQSHQYRMRAFESADGCTSASRSYLAYTAAATVPVRPTSISSTYVYDPNTSPVTRKINLAWTAGSGQTSVEVWRKSDAEIDFAKLKVLAAGTVVYSDDTVASNVAYAYKVRGCKQNGAAIGCSAFSNETLREVVSSPQNFTATLVSIAGNGGTVRLMWENTFFAATGNYIVERADGNGNFSAIQTFPIPPTALPPVSYTDAAVSLGIKYSYRVKTDFSDYSKAAEMNLNIAPVSGWAWGGNGLGWTRLASDNVKSSWGDAAAAPNESANPYLVYVEKDTGIIRGYAWNPYGGWLSLTNTDAATGVSMLNGCPLAPCEARVGADGAVTSWAKFLGADRWVSLAKKSGELVDYGLYYATTTENGKEAGQLRGFAWGGDGAGWLSFGGPALKSATLLTAPDAQGNAQVELRWENQAAYDREEIWAAEGNGSPLKIKQVDGNKTARGSQTDIVGGLEKDAQYRFFIRGYPR
ncbi:MAG: hypothetical protein V1656_01420 [Candidatus Jorgensenbacteria bacterium]